MKRVLTRRNQFEDSVKTTGTARYFKRSPRVQSEGGQSSNDRQVEILILFIVGYVNKCGLRRKTWHLLFGRRCYCIFRRLGHAELHNLFGRYPNRLTGRRVACRAIFASYADQVAETWYHKLAGS